ncbi:MAG: bifunctional pyr operon transcriptional regulator/uracil phosphoribosyltransferase PyrR [Rhodocyclaceae bacterium]|jgi:pyrimidine operon attenuation protein/uracil phosphoribosyltransferase
MLPDAEQLCLALADSLRPELAPETSLVGIHTGGVWVAERLHAALGLKTPLGRLDVSFYRDDFSRIGLHPQVKSSDIPFEVTDRPIVIVDDVLHTGRTLRAAMNEIFDYGRPARIDLAVLVDRGGRELPVCPRWSGQVLDIAPGSNLQLERSEAGILTLRLIDA